MTTKRITPEMVLAAYKATGLKPVRGTLEFLAGIDDGRGCPIDALLCAAKVEKVRTKMDAAVALGTTRNYLWGFIAAIDSQSADECKLLGPIDADEDQLMQGYADGQACAAAVFATPTP